MKRQWFHLTIRASPASIVCMSCNMANGSETHFMTIDDIRAQNACLNTDIVSVCEECICFWAMVNDRNYYVATNKKHLNCVRHWHIIQHAIFNYKLFLCIVSIWFSMSKLVTIRSISLCFVSVCTQRGWSDYMFPFSTIRFAGIVNVSNWNFFHEQTNQFREVLEYTVRTVYWSIIQRQKVVFRFKLQKKFPKEQQTLKYHWLSQYLGTEHTTRHCVKRWLQR